MSLNWDSFKAYCQRMGIKLLRDDIRYIENRLAKIPHDEHRRVMKEYTRIWIEQLSLGNGESKGRCEANLYLRGED